MNSPPKKEHGELASKTARKLIALSQYAAWTMLASVFGAPFWFFEQRRWRVADRIDNEEHDR
jgi:hypothetical protein